MLKENQHMRRGLVPQTLESEQAMYLLTKLHPVRFRFNYSIYVNK